MPDATSTVQVDGVEPSIPVKLLDNNDNPARVKLFTAEDGTERFLVKGAENYFLVTPTDLSVLGGFHIDVDSDADDNEIVVSADVDDKKPEPTTPAQNRPENTIVIPTPANPTPGQTG